MAYGSTQQNYAGPVNSGDMIVKNNQASPGIAALLRKQNMKGAQGIFQLPDTQQANPDFYNQSLMNVQNEIQGQTQTLNAMAPEGEQLAYINDQEAGILKLLGGSGDMTPQGIPSFAPPGRGGSQDRNKNFKGSYSRPDRKDPPKQSRADMINELDKLMAKNNKTGQNADQRSAKKDDTKEQNIFQKILGGNQEVRDLAASVNKKIKEVENDPNLSNYKKMQMVKQLKLAKSPGGGGSNFGMADRVQAAMGNVDQNRLRNIRLSGKDAEMLAAQGVITQDQLTKGLGLIEDYGRGLSYNPVTGSLTIAQPTVGEVGGDIRRRLTADMENFPSVSPLGLIMKALGKGGDEEEKAPTERETDFQKQVQDILYGTGMGMGPGQAIAMYGKSTPYKSGEEVAIGSDYEDNIMKIARGDRTKEDYYSGVNADEAQYLNDLIEDAMRQDGSTSPINVNPNKSYNLPDKFVVNKKTKPTSAIRRGEDLGGLNASFFDPATGGIGYKIADPGRDEGGFVNQDIIGQPAMSSQMAGDLARVMNPRDNNNNNNNQSQTTTGSTTEEDGNDDDNTYPYFGYQRQFQTPMAFQDILNRAYTSDPDRKNMLESFADMFARLKKDNA